MVMGNLKEMDPRWLMGVSMVGYGCSMALGIGVPIPVLNEEIARFTGVSDEDLFTQIIDYGNDYPKGEAASLGQVSYAELKSGTITFRGAKHSHRSSFFPHQGRGDRHDSEGLDGEGRVSSHRAAGHAADGGQEP
jgi:uncharacterized protein (DUF39 family)